MLEMLRKAHGDGVMKKNQTFMWYMRFREELQSVNVNDCTGRQSTSQTVEKVRQMIDEECAKPRILTDAFQMRNVSTKMVPKILTDEIKKQRLLKC